MSFALGSWPWCRRTINIVYTNEIWANGSAAVCIVQSCHIDIKRCLIGLLFICIFKCISRFGKY